MIMNPQAAADAGTAKANNDSIEQQQKNAEEKKQADALKGFQQALQELP